MWRARRRRNLLAEISSTCDLVESCVERKVDPAFLLEGDVLRAATELHDFLHGEAGPDVEVAEKLASLHWHRYLWSADRSIEDDLAHMLALFREVYAVRPARVPAILVPLFDSDIAETGEDEEDLGFLVRCATDLFACSATEQAIILARRAMTLSRRLDAIEPRLRIDLSTALWFTFDFTGDKGILEHAVAHARTALSEISAEREDRLLAVAALGQALVKVAGVNNDEDALRESLELLRPAVRSADPGDPLLPVAIVPLLGALVTHRSWYGPTADLISESRLLMDLIPENIPQRNSLDAAVLRGEAGYLMTLGDLTGMRELRRTIDGLLDRIEPGAPHLDRLRLSSMELAFSEHHLRHEPVPETELRRYLDAFHAADLDPRDRVSQLESVSIHLVAQAETTGDLESLDECVDLLTEGLHTLPEDSAAHRSLGAYLGKTLGCRFRDAGDPAVFDRAIALLRRRLPDLVEGTPARSSLLPDLGVNLRRHYLLTGDESSYREAMTLLRHFVADDMAFLGARLNHARMAGELAAEAGRWNEAADAFADGIVLLPELAWPGLERADQEQSLTHWSEFVNQAAAAAARAGDSTRAVELLEQGRAILTHQELDVRGDTARVRIELPELAARLDEIHQETGRTGDRKHRHDLAQERDRLVAEIRSRPGFAGFLCAPDFEALRPSDGQTVAVINVAAFGSAAFLVTASGVRNVPLPELTTDEVRERVTAFHEALEVTTRVRASSRDERRAAIDTIKDILDWLWRTTAEPVLDALGHTGVPPEGAPWPHVYWCPTWMLGFLPLHAAGKSAEPGKSVLDRVISSYALSLRTLRFASGHRDPPLDLRSLLVVSMPETPGLLSLPRAEREKDGLSGISPRTEVLSGERAVHREVSLAVRDHAWAHFACHAAQDPQNPSRGTLFLHDHQDKPFTVLDVSRLRLENAQFAFLSACETARGGLRLPNEALHLGGALQLAGYQHVIATLWRISDGIAAMVTERVYDRLRTHDDSILAPERAAEALHEAIRWLRQRYPGYPSLWASHVHFGL